MNRESYLETLKNHYADDIKEAYFECEHQLGSKVDMEALSQRLTTLLQSANFEGLSEQDFDELVQSILPDLHAQLDYLPSGKMRTPAMPKKQAA